MDCLAYFEHLSPSPRYLPSFSPTSCRIWFRVNDLHSAVTKNPMMKQSPNVFRSSEEYCHSEANPGHRFTQEKWGCPIWFLRSTTTISSIGGRCSRQASKAQRSSPFGSRSLSLLTWQPSWGFISQPRPRQITIAGGSELRPGKDR